MGNYRCPYIKAGALVRGQIKGAFQQMREWGCTVRYDTERGLLETVFSNIEIEGPDWAIRRFDNWIKQNVRLV